VFALLNNKVQAVQLQTLNSLWCCLPLQQGPFARKKHSGAALDFLLLFDQAKSKLTIQTAQAKRI
jgi:hypothetical protein